MLYITTIKVVYVLLIFVFRSKKKVFVTALGERVQSWTNGLPDRVQHLKIGGKFGRGKGGDRQYSEVCMYTYTS